MHIRTFPSFFTSSELLLYGAQLFSIIPSFNRSSISFLPNSRSAGDTDLLVAWMCGSSTEVTILHTVGCFGALVFVKSKCPSDNKCLYSYITLISFSISSSDCSLFNCDKSTCVKGSFVQSAATTSSVTWAPLDPSEMLSSLIGP